MDRVEYVLSLFDEYRNARLPWEQKWQRNFRQWLGIYERKPEDRTKVENRIFIKLTKQAIDTAVSVLGKTIFVPDWFAFDVDEDGDEELLRRRARRLKDYFEFLMETEGVRFTLENALRAMAVYGTTIGKVYPKTIEIPRFVREPAFDPEIGFPVGADYYAEYREVVRPSLDLIDIFDFYIDPYVRDIQSCRGVFHRYMTTYSELLKLQEKGVYRNVEQLKDVRGAEYETRDFSFMRIAEKEQGATEQDKRELIEVLEFWGSVPKEDGTAEERKIVIAHGVVLQDVENPYWTKFRPFVFGRWDDSMTSFYGYGIADATEGVQSALNAEIRAHIDNRKLANNLMWEVDVSKLHESQEDFEVYPGKIWFVVNGSAVRPLQFPTLTMDFNTLVTYERWMQEVSGIPKILAGQMPLKRQTATETLKQIEQASNVLANVGKRFEYTFIQPMLRMFLIIVAQFMDEREMINVSGERVVLTREEIFGNYNIRVRGTELSLAKETKIQNLLNFYQLTANRPDINTTLILRKIAELLDLDDVDEIIKEPEEILQEQAELQQKAQFLMGGGNESAQGTPGAILIGAEDMQDAGMVGAEEIPPELLGGTEGESDQGTIT